MMRSLPKSLLPPAEYDWKYTDAKIEDMWSKGVLGKTKYQKWKKQNKGFERLGAWQCAYCGWAGKCIPMESPEMAYMAFQNLDVEGEAA